MTVTERTAMYSKLMHNALHTPSTRGSATAGKFDAVRYQHICLVIVNSTEQTIILQHGWNADPTCKAIVLSFLADHHLFIIGANKPRAIAVNRPMLDIYGSRWTVQKDDGVSDICKMNVLSLNKEN